MNREPVTEGFDGLFVAGVNPLVRELWARAFGADYPAEVEPASSCSWWTLGYAITHLRMAPGSTLVDLGCGRAGPSLWLARALHSRLIGVDLSRTGLARAAEWAPRFVPEGRAEFQRGSFEATGLPDAVADGLFSVDALPFSPDIPAALREAHRILRPGGRFVFGGWESDDPEDTGPADWAAEFATAGFEVEDSRPHPGSHERWLALYALWQENEDTLRRELGDAVADDMLLEAADRPAKLIGRRSILLVAGKPVR